MYGFRTTYLPDYQTLTQWMYTLNEIWVTHCDIVILASGCISVLEITHNECQQIRRHRNRLLEMRFNSSICQGLLLNHWHVWQCFVIFIMNNHSGKCCFHCRLIKTRKCFTCIRWFKLCCSKTSTDRKKNVLAILVYMCRHITQLLHWQCKLNKKRLQNSRTLSLVKRL